MSWKKDQTRGGRERFSDLGNRELQPHKPGRSYMLYLFEMRKQKEWTIKSFSSQHGWPKKNNKKKKESWTVIWTDPIRYHHPEKHPDHNLYQNVLLAKKRKQKKNKKKTKTPRSLKFLQIIRRIYRSRKHVPIFFMDQRDYSTRILSIYLFLRKKGWGKNGFSQQKKFQFQSLTSGVPRWSCDSWAKRRT